MAGSPQRRNGRLHRQGHRRAGRRQRRSAHLWTRSEHGALLLVQSGEHECSLLGRADLRHLLQAHSLSVGQGRRLRLQRDAVLPDPGGQRHGQVHRHGFNLQLYGP
jgi:hypothetical protein